MKMNQNFPVYLKEHVAKHWQSFLTSCRKKSISPPEHPVFSETYEAVWAMSDFVIINCIRQPAMIKELFDSEKILQSYQPGEIQQALQKQLEHVSTEPELMQELRRFRQQQMLRIAWRDLAGFSDYVETTRDLSALADACIRLSLQKLHDWLSQKYGPPKNHHGAAQQLLVFAVGKLGGYELNFSSDIDLIFAFPEAGNTEHSANSVRNMQFFTRLSQKLIKTLNDFTADGYVFRVDMRLRPYGTSGPIVMNIATLCNYYQEQGRDWERYALIKVRFICGIAAAGEEVLNIMRSFVYRPYVDYGAIETLREMKSLISKDILLKKKENDIKQGPGGIREIEFIAQTQQLIHGGRNYQLQHRNLLTTLQHLGSSEFIDIDTVNKLREVYIFLRNLEHRIQMIADQQTHSLPKDDFTQTRIAFAMGFADWPALIKVLRQHRAFVLRLFHKGTAEPNMELLSSAKNIDRSQLHALWSGKLPPQEALRLITKLGFPNQQECLRLLNEFHDNMKKQLPSWNARKRLLQIGPQMLLEMSNSNNPTTTMLRIFSLLETLMRRSGYLVLLLENPRALGQLITLCSASPWIANRLTSSPELLGELRDSRTLYAPLDTTALRQELELLQKQIGATNVEQQMEMLRYFKKSQILRVAAADITEKLPIMKVSDHLTFTATTILQQVQKLAWQQVIKRHGKPAEGAVNIHHQGFAIIGYGKLGGIELGYSSDLDLVFIYDDLPFVNDTQNTIEYTKFYSRLAQAIIQISNKRTASGVLYEIDTRLRPSGNAGLLVTSINAFKEYQLQQAWTWEHQALVRARIVSGDESLEKQFNQIRQDVLTEKRDKKQLAQEIVNMRQRMRQAAKQPPANSFDLKQGIGGIADIEFIVQFGILLWSHQHHELLTYTDNIRILEDFAKANLMTKPTIQLLCDAYRAYRAKGHRLALQRQAKIVADDEFVEYRQAVTDVWYALIENTLH